MECELNPRIPYTELSHIIKKQKEVYMCLHRDFVGVHRGVNVQKQCSMCMYMCGRDKPGLRFLPCLLGKAKSKCYHLLSTVWG